MIGLAANEQDDGALTISENHTNNCEKFLVAEAEPMRVMSREFLESECLRVAQRVPDCRDLTAVKIARTVHHGSGPNWYVDSFVPALPPIADKEARLAVIHLAGMYALEK